ncbi:hypothetical protein E0504_24785 [Parafrankia sp. BMG5.11]|nr:hypothetical protein E0504_24785 [Parafrankia sp. BMG5.11]
MVVAGVDERRAGRAVPRPPLARWRPVVGRRPAAGPSGRARPMERGRNTWLVRVAGLSVGSLAVGLVIGFLLPR